MKLYKFIPIMLLLIVAISIPVFADESTSIENIFQNANLQYTSIDYDNEGLAYVSYYNVSDTDLYLAKTNSSGVWSTVELDNSAGTVGQYSKIVIDDSGVANVVYYDSTNVKYKHARYLTNGTIVLQDIYSTNNSGHYLSLMVDSGGDLHLITEDIRTPPPFGVGSSDIRHSIYDGTSWSTSLAFTQSVLTSLDAVINAEDEIYLGINTYSFSADTYIYGYKYNGTWNGLGTPNNVIYYGDISVDVSEGGDFWITYGGTFWSLGTPIGYSMYNGTWTTDAINTTAVGFNSISTFDFVIGGYDFPTLIYGSSEDNSTYKVEYNGTDWNETLLDSTNASKTWMSSIYSNAFLSTVYLSGTDLNISRTSFINYTTTQESPVIETTENSFSLTVIETLETDQITSTFYYNGVEYPIDSRVTSGVAGGTATVMTVDVQAPLVESDTNISWHWDVTKNVGGSYDSVTNTFIGGTNYYTSTATEYQEVNTINFTYCPSGGDVVYNFTFFNEDGWGPITGVDDYFALFEISGEDAEDSKFINFTVSGADYIPLCLGTNETDGLSINAEISYRKDGYDARNYYLLGAEFTDATQEIKLYSLNISLASQITFQIQDKARQPQGDKYGYIQRKDLGSNNYKTVAMIKTNANGEDFAYLRKSDSSAKYRFIIFDETGTLYSSEATSLVDDTVSITLPESTYSDYISILDNIERNLEYFESTGQFVATWVDLSGSVTNNCLKVTKSNLGNIQEIGEECSTGASGTLIIEINNTVEGSYHATFYNQINPSSFIDLFEEVQGAFADLLGKDGIFFAFLLVLGLALLGVATGSISWTVAGASLGLFISKALSLISLEWNIITGLLVIGALIIYLARDRNV